jgi:hypothetical protein
MHTKSTSRGHAVIQREAWDVQLHGILMAALIGPWKQSTAPLASIAWYLRVSPKLGCSGGQRNLSFADAKRQRLGLPSGPQLSPPI